MHGFGAPGDDLVPLGDMMGGPDGIRYAFPAAPLGLPGPYMGGRAWWMIDPGRFEQALYDGSLDQLIDEEPDGLATARDQALRMLDGLQAELSVSSSRMVLGGFSQGAMMATEMACHDDRPLAGLVVWSGTYLARPRWREQLQNRRGLPVFQSHGEDDPLLPCAIAETLRDDMKAAGLEVEWTPFPGGHGIPPQVLAGTQAFIGRVLG